MIYYVLYDIQLYRIGRVMNELAGQSKQNGVNILLHNTAVMKITISMGSGRLRTLPGIGCAQGAQFTCIEIVRAVLKAILEVDNL